ncbi:MULTISPECIES: type II toxin-antitoxin system YafQ family toxin [Moorena]|uniref:type II toxin-antitoxin system YafQ family toxin n=1 Tax=unclassified Moorena TaxID=2683338 RepID=UPI000B03564B|nr:MULTISPECIES: type II toxin-antitoxin system YafQ family toxin [unclassified Moorena]
MAKIWKSLKPFRCAFRWRIKFATGRTSIDNLLERKELEPKYKDHALTGNWSGYRDCHIEPDWILIYKISGTHLFLVRSGSHADLF